MSWRCCTPLMDPGDMLLSDFAESRLQGPAPLGHALRNFFNNTSPSLVTLCLTETLKRCLSSAARAQDKFGLGVACHRYNRHRAKDLNAVMAHVGPHQPCYTTLSQLASGTPCPRLLPAVRLLAAMLHVSCRACSRFFWLISAKSQVLCLRNDSLSQRSPPCAETCCACAHRQATQKARAGAAQVGG